MLSSPLRAVERDVASSWYVRWIWTRVLNRGFLSRGFMGATVFLLCRAARTGANVGLVLEGTASLASPALHRPFGPFLPRGFLGAAAVLVGGASALGAASREKVGRASVTAMLLVSPERAATARLCSILWARAGVEGAVSGCFFTMPLVCDIRIGKNMRRGFGFARMARAMGCSFEALMSGVAAFA
jgi:hypothetical protein